MIFTGFTRIVPALLVAAVAAQALYIPDVLYAREFEEFSELSEHGTDQKIDKAIRDAFIMGLTGTPDTAHVASSCKMET